MVTSLDREIVINIAKKSLEAKYWPNPSLFRHLCSKKLLLPRKRTGSLKYFSDRKINKTIYVKQDNNNKSLYHSKKGLTLYEKQIVSVQLSAESTIAIKACSSARIMHEKLQGKEINTVRLVLENFFKAFYTLQWVEI